MLLMAFPSILLLIRGYFDLGFDVGGKQTLCEGPSLKLGIITGRMQTSAKLPGKEIEQRFKLPLLCSEGGLIECDSENEVVIKIFVDMNVGIGGDIWPAANIFCSWMMLPQYNNFFSSLINSRRVLELGSGNSLVSILVEKAFTPQEVVVSDLESHVPHMQHNLEMNKCKCSKAIALDWTDDGALCEKKFDVILALEW